MEALSIAAPIVGGLIGSKSASSAAKTQADATAAASAELGRQFDASMALQRPAVDTGNVARNKLSGLLGLDLTGTSAGFDGAAYLAANPDVAANPAFAANPYQHYQQYGQAENRQYTPLAGIGGTTGTADITTDPGYQFRLQQGQQALDNRAAAGGGYFSGASLKAASAYNSGQASQEFGNITNRLAGLAGAGQTAATNSGQTATAYGNNSANLITANGNAQAASGIAGANAITGGINSGLNGYYQNNLLAQLAAGKTT